jgi:hypothetical protein
MSPPAAGRLTHANCLVLLLSLLLTPSVCSVLAAQHPTVQQHRRLLAGNGAVPGMPGGGDMAKIPRDEVPPLPPMGEDRDALPSENGAAPGARHQQPG